ncbi:hypothetical protein [Clostridium botulinum]|uniref:hypothetical protein n=1 Tax=Clostridium botulinum TaxID=1491 RepID=UPI001967949F|nr:hypothetical protein [Clostridium botulinum]
MVEQQKNIKYINKLFKRNLNETDLHEILRKNLSNKWIDSEKWNEESNRIYR